MIDYEKTKKLLSKSIVESNNNQQVKSNMTFDSSIDYRIRTEFGTTYRIEESLSNNIIFTKDQQYFINYVILNGDINKMDLRNETTFGNIETNLISAIHLI